MYTVTVTIGTDLFVLLRSTLVAQPYTLVSDLWPPFPPSLSWPYMVVTVVNTSPVFSFPPPPITDGYIRHRSAVCVTTVVISCNPSSPLSINSRRNNCAAVGCSGKRFYCFTAVYGQSFGNQYLQHFTILQILNVTIEFFGRL